MLLPGESKEWIESEDVGYELLEKYWGIDRSHATIVRHIVYRFETRLAKSWREGRVILAGDAAHLMPPFMGQGMCSGLRDVANLSWRLDLVLRNRLNESALDSYEEERRDHVKNLIQISADVANVVTVLDPIKAEERNELLRSEPGRHDFASHLLDGVLQWNEDGSAAELAGELFIQGRVFDDVGVYGDIKDSKPGKLDDIAGKGWQVITRHPIPEGLLTPRELAVLEALEAKVVHISRGRVPNSLRDIDAVYENWFTKTGRVAAIQRPDSYLYGTVSDFADLPALIRVLGEQVDVNIVLPA